MDSHYHPLGRGIAANVRESPARFSAHAAPSPTGESDSACAAKALIRAATALHEAAICIASLQIEGIKGESTDDKHKDWIEVSSVVWGRRPYKRQSRTVNIVFKKLADSAILLQHCAAGKTIPNAVFEFMRADGDGKPIPYYRVELENVMVSGVTPNSGDGGMMTEQVHLASAIAAQLSKKLTPYISHIY